jgi:hypothetical protein
MTHVIDESNIHVATSSELKCLLKMSDVRNKRLHYFSTVCVLFLKKEGRIRRAFPCVCVCVCVCV